MLATNSKKNLNFVSYFCDNIFSLIYSFLIIHKQNAENESNCISFYFFQKYHGYAVVIGILSKLTHFHRTISYTCQKTVQ